MPPLPRLHIGAIQDLERQLRFVPPGMLRKQIDRVEALCGELSPGQMYPAEWLVFRVTGYRMETPPGGRGGGGSDGRSGGAGTGAGVGVGVGVGGGSELLVGRALLADLVVLVERLCDAAELREEELIGSGGAGREVGGMAEGAGKAGEWLDAEAVCARWGISRKSLDRYRREGLAGRRVRTAGRRVRLYFRRAVVEGFEKAHAERLTAARGFTRIEPGMQAKMLRLAAKYHARLGWSLNQTALRLAERFERSHEAVRGVLKRELGVTGDRRGDRGAKDDVAGAEGEIRGGRFREVGPLTAKQVRVIVRAYARGIEVDALAERFGKTKPAIYRAIHVQRAERLRGIDFTEFAELDRPPGSIEAALEHPAARFVVGPRPPEGRLRTLADLMAYAAGFNAIEATVERAIATAFLVLVHRARAGIGALSKHHPSAAAIDRIETDLRWAAALKERLVLSQFPLLLKSLRVQIGGELVDLPRGAAERLLEDAIRAVIVAVDGHDPTRGGRLAAPVGLAITRAASQSQRGLGGGGEGGEGGEGGASKAKRFTSPAGVTIGAWETRLFPWQAMIEPGAGVRERLGGAAEVAQRLVRLRYGWASAGAVGAGGDGSGPPQTLMEAGAALGMTAQHAGGLERRTLIALGRMRDEAAMRAT